MAFVKKLKQQIRKIPIFIFYKFYTRYICNRYIEDPKVKKVITDEFHKLYYNSSARTWTKTFWLNAAAEKCPLDLWVYQEIIFELKPDIIIETGTCKGGSALFLASICDLVNNGKIITIDIKDAGDRPKHERITYLLGSSTSREIIEKVKSMILNKKKVMVILDSDHTGQHVLDELRIYSKFITKGSYIIVEDTNSNGHPVTPNFGPGPFESVEEFLKEDKNFIIDKTREKFYLTFNPDGYLKRIGE